MFIIPLVLTWLAYVGIMGILTSIGYDFRTWQYWAVMVLVCLIVIDVELAMLLIGRR